MLTALFTLFVLTPSPIQQHHLYIKEWNATHGLDDGEITSLFYHPRGHLLIGSEWGISAFDGQNISRPKGLPVGRIHALTGSSNQTWVLIQKAGLFHQSSNRDFRSVSLPKDVNPTELASLAMVGETLFVFSNAKSFYRQNNRWSSLDIAGPVIDFDVNRTHVWVLSKDRLYRLDEQGTTQIFNLDQTAQSLAVNDFGDIWLGVDNILCVLNPFVDKHVVHATLGGPINRIDVQDSWVWIETDKALYRYDTALNHIQEIRPLDASQPWKSNPEIGPQNLTVEANHVFWSYGSKLYYHHRDYDYFQFVQSEDLGPIHSVFGYDKGLWLGLEDGLYHPLSKRKIAFQNQASQAIHTISLVNETLWLGLERGLGRYQQGIKEIQVLPLPKPFENARVTTLFPTANQQLILGSDAGLLFFDHDSGQFKDPFHEAGAIYDIVDMTAKGLFVLGDRGLWHRQNGVWQMVDLHIPAMRHLEVDYTDKLWIGGARGLLCMDPVTRHIEKSDLDLQHPSIRAMCIDPLNQLWLSTPVGLTRIDASNGLVSQHMSWLPSYSHMSSGLRFFCFANDKQVAFFDPLKADHTSLPKLRLEGISWQEQDHDKHSQKGSLTLPNEHRDLVLNWTLLDGFLGLNAPAQWRLQPTGSWQNIDSQKLALGRLGPGNYVVEMRLPFQEAQELASIRVQDSRLMWLGLVIALLLGGLVSWLILRHKKQPQANPIASTTDLASLPKAPLYTKAHPLILLVDDDVLNLEVLRELLANCGFQLLTAQNGADAVALCQEHVIDLILLDVMMPGMSGYEVCSVLRKNFSLQELPIIFLTARTSKADLVRGFEAGGNDYLTKPIVTEELMARITMHLQLKRIHYLLDKEKALLVTEVELQNQRILAKDASLRLLHVQMSPHFLHNVLNTASWLCVSDPNNARRMLYTLSRFLRKSFNAAPQAESPFSEELARIDLFCEIQKMRFRDKLKIEMDIDEAVKDLILPVFLVQPLVENAILHGFEGSLKKAPIRLKCLLDDSQLIVEVSNGGKPLDKPLAELLDQGHALGNIARRLELIYGAELTSEYQDGILSFGFKLDRSKLKTNNQSHDNDVSARS